MFNPWRRLIAAIIYRAVLDARSDNEHAPEARVWLLTSSMAKQWIEELDLDLMRIRVWIIEEALQ